MLSTAAKAVRLSRPQRQILIDHIDRPRLIRVNIANEMPSLRGMVHDGLLRWAPFHGCTPAWERGSRSHPTHTLITEEGRYALSAILADYAETLVKLGIKLSVEDIMARALGVPIGTKPVTIAAVPGGVPGILVPSDH